ncbi:alginate lyase family protein [Peribacillus sp. SCS-155]|uniref:alginate lyase family protein n=1 Tax=Peribacillus sedimenti TaxID=3115297 RepID=UPI003905DB11
MNSAVNTNDFGNNDSVTPSPDDQQVLKSLLTEKSDAMKALYSCVPADISSLQKEYIDKNLHEIPDRFILYRIIGNDLYPRHKKGQSYDNLKFILENEQEFEGCAKWWVVNRIINKDEEEKIIGLLKRHNKPYLHLPFVEDLYKNIGFDFDCLPEADYLSGKDMAALGPTQRDRLMASLYRLKNNYVMNNNHARNVALRDGKQKAKWILPWDGNCFLTNTAWEQIRNDILSAAHLKYFVVPMTRVLENNELLDTNFVPNPVEEPQIIFRSDSKEEFNEEYCYGRRSKIELFWRLGIPGKWDRWKNDPWDLARPEKSREAHQFGVAGWVARLFSGMKSLELDSAESFNRRGLARMDGIISIIRSLDMRYAMKPENPLSLSFYDYGTLIAEKERHYSPGGCLVPVQMLFSEAKAALKRGPYSVTDKTTLPPSGDINDYWHPAPYWWPNPDTEDGLPYIQRDGERVPGTRLYEPESDKYDRTRLQRVFDDSVSLALAWFFTEEETYAQHGARILDRFFVNESTRMSPHLNFAQVRMGRNHNRGSSTGIIEMKDLYYYLDSVRLLESSGQLPEQTVIGIKSWLSNYLEWLLQSNQGKKERAAKNNHGTYYDLQVSAIADYLAEKKVLFESLIRAQSRIPLQFETDGSQPEEMTRTNTAHYCCFNLQGWISLSEIASRWGMDLWSYKAANGASLLKGVQWLLLHSGKKWPYPQMESFSQDRFFPIWFAAPSGLIEIPNQSEFPESKYLVKPRFFPHDGIRPYWNLGLKES